MHAHKRSSFFLVLSITLVGALFIHSNHSFAAIESKQPDESRSVVIRDITIVNVKTGELEPNQTVVTRGNQIVEIDGSNDIEIPDGATVIPATGKYLIPGLWDMHVHLMNDFKYAFPLLLANGVTGVRDMATELKNIADWKKEVEDNNPAPRITYSGSTLIQPQPDALPHLYPVTSEKSARDAVRLMKKHGAESIKVYSFLPRHLYKYIIDEARKLNMKVGGHLPIPVRAEEASRLGQRSFEHLDGLFIATSREEDKLLKLANKNPDEHLNFELEAFKTYDAQKANKLFKLFKKYGTYQVPTLITYLKVVSPLDKELAPYVPKHYWAAWEKAKKEMSEYKELIQKSLQNHENSKKMIKRMNEAGVPIMTGTDSTFGIPNHVYGKSVHEELRLLVASGLTPLEALQAATLTPAKFMDREQELGTIEEDKLADMVILHDNPLDQIENTERIYGVVMNGTYYGKGELDEAVKTVINK